MMLERFCSLSMSSPPLQIVTAELKAESNRDVVIYKIRVGDDTGEWTVSRRFRNFETLHRALRCCLSSDTHFEPKPEHTPLNEQEQQLSCLSGNRYMRCMR